ncbi:MAG: hypothetical protein M8364_00220 [Methylobacter sp.]|uniref:hypothetical protein n=1 Tax=Methylobacter sp. TaxID=2051955 RepID=UPI002590DDA6|nr:hypothetical protein [Methylobacter sp.]MCL7419317.1 hypothetical protein [Methylobacter sp.]
METLSTHDRINHLYSIITKLSNSAIESTLLYSVLDQLTPAILIASNGLELRAINGKASLPMDKTKKLVNLAIRLIKPLCFTYCNISNDNTLTKSQQASIVYKAMQLASLLTRRGTVFYQAPDSALWAKISELYLHAQSLDVLNIAIQDVVPDLARHPTIEAVLKQTLLFSICNPYQYSALEIDDIFSATGRLCHLLELDPNPSESSFFCWHPESLTAPRYADPDRAEEGALYINTSKLTVYIQANTAPRQHYRTFLSTLNRLNAFETIRESTDPVNPVECNMAIGTAKTTQFLTMLINKYRILELSGIMEEQAEPAKLELEPMEHEKNTFGLLTTKLLKDEKPAFIINTRAFKTHSPYFYMAKISQDCAIGEPLVFIRENKRPLLAIIRHLRIEPVVNMKNILLEILDGDVYPIERNEKEGFIIKYPARAAEVLLTPDNHATGTEFFIDRGLISGTFRLDKFIESTPHFMRFQVSRVID